MAYDKLLSFHRTTMERLRHGREAVCRAAYENALFDLGKHHIRFDGRTGLFRRVNSPSGSPQVVENIYKAKLGESIAMLSAIEPSLTFAPGTDSETDRLTADTARLVLRYLEDLVELEDIRRRLSYHVAIYANAWTLVDFDPTRGHFTTVPIFKCKEKEHTIEGLKAVMSDRGPVCPEDGSPLVPAGKTKREPQGLVTCDVLTPFELWCDYSIQRMRDQPVVVVRRMRTREWVRAHYPNSDAARSPTDQAKDGRPGPTDIGLTYLQNIIRLQPSLRDAYGSFGARFTNAVVVDDIYALPCAEYPKGLLGRVIDDMEGAAEKPLPFHDGTEEDPGEPMIPVEHWGFDDVPGALLCRSPADDLKEPQRERNRLLAHIMLYFARMANGVWAIPENADVSTIHGTEGVIIKYQTTAAGGGAPTRLEGARLPNSFAERLVQIENTMDQIVSAGAVNIGEFPRADSAAFINTLHELQQRRMGPVYRRWGKSYENLARHLFQVFRLFAPDEAFYRAKGEEARWSVTKLKAADIRGGVDIRVESSSLVPKTMLQRRAAYEQALAMGLADMTSPDIRLKYARALGVTELLDSLSKDEDYIGREHDAFRAWVAQVFDPETGAPREGIDPDSPDVQLPVLVDPDLDIHPLHWERHRVWMLSEEFQSFPMAAQEIFRNGHLRVHAMVQNTQGAAKAQAAAPTGGPSGKSDGGQRKEEGRQERKESSRQEAA